MLKARFAATAIIFLGAGCVPLTDYRKLEERYKEQEKYVQKHKDEVSEFQKREQMLTMQKIQQQKDLEIALARLAKSEILRRELEANKGKTIVVEKMASAPIGNAETTFGSFKINTETGGIVLEHDVLFESGKHTLKASGKSLLDTLVGKLRSSEFSRYCIRIDGHTDDAPVVKTVKENHDNWELGFKRAKCVFDYMVSKGLPQDRCFLASFSSTRPIVGSSSKMPMITKKSSKKIDKKKTSVSVDSRGNAQNRRVEIVLFEKK